MMGRTFGLAAGEVLAVDLPPGPAWVEVVHRCWNERVPFFPLDARLSDEERRALVDLAQPAALVDASGELTLFAPASRGSEDLAVVVATSGTAGLPRLVELSRQAVEAAVTGSTIALEIDQTEPWVSCLTPAHVGGLLVLLRAEMGGAPVEVMGGFDAGVVAAARERGAHVAVVPTMVHRLLESGAGLDPGGVLLVGGAALDPDLQVRAEADGARVVQTYGLTESCGGVVYDGVPFDGTEVRFGPSERIELLGPTLMEGYRHDAAATGAAFDVQGWLRTGDAGSLDEDGRLLVRGRLDDAILTGAEIVWPVEVERVLLRHPKVREVAVAGRPHPEWGQQVAAFVVPVSLEDPPTLPELRVLCAEHIATFKAPRTLTLLTEIPTTASGKVRRDAFPS